MTDFLWRLPVLPTGYMVGLKTWRINVNIILHFGSLKLNHRKSSKIYNNFWKYCQKLKTKKEYLTVSRKNFWSNWVKRICLRHIIPIASWDFSKTKKKINFTRLTKLYRSSRSQTFLETDALKNFAVLTGKPLCQNFLLIRLKTWEPATLLMRDSNTGVFHVYKKFWFITWKISV